MLVKHLDSVPQIDASAWVAPTATVCGDVRIGRNARILYGASVIAEGGAIEIGDNCVVLENAVLRSTSGHSLKIGCNVLIGPNAHVVGCTVEDNVFIATGAAIFHGARLCRGAEVRINGVVHIRTVLPENGMVPIGWVAAGDPAIILSPDRHDEIWAVQKPLNFPLFVYGVDRREDGESNMPEIMRRMTQRLEAHAQDSVIESDGQQPE
jgi:carbonic anhydrase/acetyltransferase-like protein (isoleucine patch superfamily)